MVAEAGAAVLAGKIALRLYRGKHTQSSLARAATIQMAAIHISSLFARYQGGAAQKVPIAAMGAAPAVQVMAAHIQATAVVMAAQVCEVVTVPQAVAVARGVTAAQAAGRTFLDTLFQIVKTVRREPQIVARLVLVVNQMAAAA